MFNGKACPKNPNGTPEIYASTDCRPNPPGGDYYCAQNRDSADWSCCTFGTNWCNGQQKCITSRELCFDAPNPKATNPPVTGDIGCPHYTDASGNPTSDSKSECRADSACQSGARRGNATNDTACQQFYPNDASKKFCCIDARVANTASAGNAVSINSGTCTLNSQCGKAQACVFTNNPNKGVCR